MIAMQVVGKLDADLLLLPWRENVDHTVDGFCGGVRVQSRKDQVSRFCRRNRKGDGFRVAHLTDEQDVRVFAQRGAQCVRKALRVSAQLPLVDKGHLVRRADIRSGLRS